MDENEPLVATLSQPHSVIACTYSFFSNYGSLASSGAGALGGEIVGKTSKYDGQIDEWIDAWLDKYQQYDFTEEKCQKFACEFVRWLTDGIFTIPHRQDVTIHYTIRWKFNDSVIMIY